MIKSITYEFNLDEEPFREGETPMSYAKRQTEASGYPNTAITDISLDIELVHMYFGNELRGVNSIRQVLIVKIKTCV